LQLNAFLILMNFWMFITTLPVRLRPKRASGDENLN